MHRPFFRVRHRTRRVVRHSSSQATLLEFAGTRWSVRCRFGLQSARLAPSSSQQHHAPHITHHAPCPMPHARLTVLHRARCAMHCWHITSYARHHASCTTHHVPRTLGIRRRRCTLGIVHRIPSPCTTTTRHPRSHRHTASVLRLVWMSHTMPYPVGSL